MMDIVTAIVTNLKDIKMGYYLFAILPNINIMLGVIITLAAMFAFVFLCVELVQMH